MKAYMDFNGIKSGLERLSRLADGWEHNGVSSLERDIALDELRKIYSAIRFAAERESAPRPDALESTISEPDADARSTTVDNEPIAVALAVDATAETAETVETAEQAAVEAPAADNAEQNIAAAAELPSSEPADKSEPRNLDGVQSLFNEDELPVGHRRRIMMSLYGDDSSAQKIKAAEHLAVEPAADTLREAPTNSAAAVNDVAQRADIGVRAVDRTPAATDFSPNAAEHSASVSQLLENEQIPESEPVLGEVINNDLRTVADTITPALNIAETAGREHVDDLNEAIGINDRFLLIRDLFGGRTSVYEEAIHKINGFDNLDDCMVYIVENFDWNPNADATKLLMQLIERKYSR